jgi:MFS transporter, DHA3 family, macrolide efflux protein
MMTPQSESLLFSKTSRPFLIMWFGQAISLIGTGISRFALMIFAWEITGQATAVTIAGVASMIPGIVIGIFVGTLVDRWDRKFILIASDMFAGLTTLGLLVIEADGSLQLWHIYVALLIIGTAEAFQNPAYVASVTLMVSKSLYSRSSGLLTLATYLSTVASPILASILLPIAGLAGIFSLDILTFVFGVITMMLITIPQPKRQLDETSKQQSFWQESLFGMRYILNNPSLLSLTLVGLMWNMTESIGYPLIAPFILARTNGDEAILATVMSVMGVGGVIGGIIASVWSGFKRKIHNVLIGAVLTGILGDVLLGIGTTLPIWVIAGIGIEFFIPLSIGSMIAIWQIKIPVELQGRIFATRRVLAHTAGILITLAVGPLADHVFEPAMMPEGQLAPVFGRFIAPGQGAGMGLMLVQLC